MHELFKGTAFLTKFSAKQPCLAILIISKTSVSDSSDSTVKSLLTSVTLFSTVPCLTDPLR